MAQTKRKLKRNTKIIVRRIKTKRTRKLTRKSKSKKPIDLYNIEYPYYKQTVTKQDIIKHFKKLFSCTSSLLKSFLLT